MPACAKRQEIALMLHWRSTFSCIIPSAVHDEAAALAITDVCPCCALVLTPC
jgi:hypothetical protein